MKKEKLLFIFYVLVFAISTILLCSYMFDIINISLFIFGMMGVIILVAVFCLLSLFI